ncbi:PIH1 domain-containing protein Nop17-like [Arctopsyche grandis]|uniref:PIH1 domain-containing protein Nop17-like n=1 Tax=Arctopsyche grandis TaxID=121162 RepID=UPI00406D7550
MAAGRRGDLQLTGDELDRIEAALKDAEFRKLLLDYCQEMQDPKTQQKYKREFTQMEKQRGHIVTFLEPQPGYVVKTSQGETKAFINVCSNTNIDPPACNWPQLSLPHALTPPKDHKDSSGRKCIVYDVIFHTNTLLLAAKNENFKRIVTTTACDAVQQSYAPLDMTNLKFPKSSYKGAKVPTITRKPDLNHKPEEPTLLDELYPQTSYIPPQHTMHKPKQTPDYTVPKYVLKHTRHVDMKEFTYEKDARQHLAIPTCITLEINLPLLSSVADVVLDVRDRSFKLLSEKPARYKLEFTLPYKVDDEAGSAKFDLDKRTLFVSLPVVQVRWCSREDSGVESDANSPCHSDEDNMSGLVVEVSDRPGIEVVSENEVYRTSVEDGFLDTSISYSLPAYLCHVIDDTLVLTLQIKNVDQGSIVTEHRLDVVKLKFNSVGAGYFPIHHAMFLKFPDGAECGRPAVEVWDNNVVVQISIGGTAPIDHYYIGIDEFKKEVLETSIQVKPIEAICSNFKETFHISEPFLDSDLLYSLPNYTLNTLDEVAAFTFHVKNVDAKSFSSKQLDDGVWMKFSSINGEGSVDHFAIRVKFLLESHCKVPSLDVWDNNTVIQLEFEDRLPDHLYVGSSEVDLKKHNFNEADGQDIRLDLVDQVPIVEVIAKGNNETNISVIQDEYFDDRIKLIPKKHRESCDISVCSSGGSFKGILKYRSRINRSLSESNVDLVEYNMSPSYSLSSADCIPEESSSLKKTVRFSNVIAKQTFRANSSILGQKSKNQRKKRNKKRAQERRASEGDPDDMSLDVMMNEDVFEEADARKDLANLDHRDSGALDTDEGDSDKCDSEKESAAATVTDSNKTEDADEVFSFSPRQTKKGKYQEVNFKNDMIFDLDM